MNITPLVHNIDPTAALQLIVEPEDVDFDQLTDNLSWEGGKVESGLLQHALVALGVWGKDVEMFRVFWNQPEGCYTVTIITKEQVDQAVAGMLRTVLPDDMEPYKRTRRD